MAMSSVGIGSGLDVNSIVSQFVAIEKQPLKALQTKAAQMQAQMSTVGQIQSQVTALQSAATKLGSVLDWKGITATSSNTSALTVTATTAALPTTFSVDVTALAKAQSLAMPTSVGSPALPASTDQLGYGTLSIQVGSKTPVTVTITDGEGTLEQIAAKINATEGVGVTASVMNDGTGKQNLLIRSNSTGTDGAFTITATEGTGGSISVPSNLSRLSYTAGSYNMNATQAAQNAAATVNGVAVSSQTNVFKDVLPGVSLTAAQVTTQPVGVTVARDTAAITKNLQDFASAYNALNATLADATKYDAETGQAGPLQGDSVTNALTSALRRLVSSTIGGTGSTYTLAAEVGITAKLGGALNIDTAKFSQAMTADADNLQKFFTAFNGSSSTNGFGLRMKDFASGLLAATGTVTNKTTALKQSLQKNATEQDRINNKATLFEERLRKQYSTLDKKMASLTALNSYVAQQVTTWNKSSG